jgi:hypothetical protein
MYLAACERPFIKWEECSMVWSHQHYKERGSFCTRKWQKYDSVWRATHVLGTGLPISMSVEAVSSWTSPIFDEMCVESVSTFWPLHSVECVCTILKSTWTHTLITIGYCKNKWGCIYSRAWWCEYRCLTPSTTLGGMPSSLVLLAVFIFSFSRGCLLIWGVRISYVLFVIQWQFVSGVCVLHHLYVMNLWLVDMYRLPYTICSPVVGDHTRPTTG